MSKGLSKILAEGKQRDAEEVNVSTVPGQSHIDLLLWGRAFGLAGQCLLYLLFWQQGLSDYMGQQKQHCPHQPGKQSRMRACKS